MPIPKIYIDAEHKYRAVIQSPSPACPIRWVRKRVLPPMTIITPASGSTGQILSPPIPVRGAIAVCVMATRTAGTGFNLRYAHVVTDASGNIWGAVGPTAGTMNNPSNTSWISLRYNLTTGYPAIVVAADAAWSSGSATYLMIVSLAFAS